MILKDDAKIEALGLGPLQGRVYLAALELGQATIQALSRKSGVNRSTIYTFIDDMKSRGFLFETKRARRKIYSAVHPEKIVELQKRRARNLEGMLPELLAINNASSARPRVTYYEGMQGIEEVYKDMLRTKTEIVAYEDIQHLKEGLPTEIYKWFPKERASRNIAINTISRDTVQAREFSKNDKDLLRKTKFIKASDFKTDINIYGDKIALMDLRGNPAFCVLIENKNLAETMRMIWRQLWDRI